MNRIPIAGCAAAVPLGLLALVYVFGPSIVGGPAFIPQTEPLLTDQKLSLLSTVADQTATMLTSILLGLFVLVGFSIQNSRSRSRHWGQYLAIAFFLVFSFFGFYFAFAARMQVMEFVGYSYADFDAVRDTLASLATVVAVASSAAFYAAVDAFLR